MMVERLGTGCAVLLLIWILFAAGISGTPWLLTHVAGSNGWSWAYLKHVLSTAGIWAGALAGVLTITDWSVPAESKGRFKDRLVGVWVWLAQQSRGRFTRLLFHIRAQRAFAILTHFSIGLIVLLFLGQRVGRFRGIRVILELGHPRLYPFQIWIDVSAVVLSSWWFGWHLYPRLAAWIADGQKLRTYFKRALGLYAAFWFLLFTVLLLQSPVLFLMMSKFDFDKPDAAAQAIEDALHGRAVVVVVHALTALLSAPVMAGLLMLQTVIFCSVYWLLLVWLVMIMIRSAQYFVERIVAGNQGPVLAISALLVAVSSALKLFN